MEDMILVPVSMVRKVVRLTGNRMARKLLIEHLAAKAKPAKKVETEKESKPKTKKR